MPDSERPDLVTSTLELSIKNLNKQIERMVSGDIITKSVGKKRADFIDYLIMQYFDAIAELEIIMYERELKK